jgi:hypothetical protein
VRCEIEVVAAGRGVDKGRYGGERVGGSSIDGGDGGGERLAAVEAGKVRVQGGEVEDEEDEAVFAAVVGEG